MNHVTVTILRYWTSHWDMRTSFEPRSVCDSLWTRGFLQHSCTRDILVALTDDDDALFQRDTCAHLSMCKGSDRRQRLSCWILRILHLIFTLNPIPHVVCLPRENTCALTLSFHLEDATSGGGGTRGIAARTSSWWSLGSRIKGRIPNVVAEPRVMNPQQGVLPMTKQHFRNFSNGRS